MNIKVTIVHNGAVYHTLCRNAHVSHLSFDHNICDIVLENGFLDKTLHEGDSVTVQVSLGFTLEGTVCGTSGPKQLSIKVITNV